MFKIADDNGLLLLDLKDLRSMLQYVGDNAKQFTTDYGNISTASIGAIQRGLLQLEEQGGDKFFGEPALNIDDLMQTDSQGRGVVNILAADKLMQQPKLYATLLLWMLSELFERLPEVGDPRQAQARVLLRRGAPAVQRRAAGAAGEDRAGGAADPLQGRGRLLRHPEPAGCARDCAGPARQPRAARAARLHPARPEGGEDGGEHAARQSRSRHREGHHRDGRRRGAGVASSTRRAGPASSSAPGCWPPGSRIGPITPEERKRIIQASLVFGHYEKTVDRESAYEKLKAAAGAKLEAAGAQTGERPRPAGGGSVMDVLGGILLGSTGPRGGQREGVLEVGGQERGSIGRIAGRARDHPRRARLAAGRRDGSAAVIRAAGEIPQIIA